MAKVAWTAEARVRHYRIAYLIRENTGEIDILGVFHGALPIERYLL